MKQRIESLISSALHSLVEQDAIPNISAEDIGASLHVERARDAAHGDFASNVALVLAKRAKSKPRDLAETIIAAIAKTDDVEEISIAGPGFINFRITRLSWLSLIEQIRSDAEVYGMSKMGSGQKVLLEFVSANPTGPLHVGHGRGAAYGDALARVLRAGGYQVDSEYYVNDAGRQMDILALSVWLRYLQQENPAVEFTPNGYQGDYVVEIAGKLKEKVGDQFRNYSDDFFSDLPEDGDAAVDLLVERCKQTLGVADFKILFDQGCDALVEDIRQDLAEFGVEYQGWFSERSLVTNGAMEKSIAVLEQNGHVYEKEGAKWFRATDFGDEKDRVVMRANGSHTYFATDLAYHFDKGERGYDRLLDVFGADHHGYIKRIKASFEALGHPPDKLDILLVQFAILYRGKEKVSMSTRGGDFVTLRELRDEVGNDAARFFYALRKPDQHMDFDLDLAKSQSLENPVYYVQYAHARICSVFRKIEEKGMPGLQSASPDYTLLVEEQELGLVQTLARFPEVVESAARSLEPHQVAYYLRDLAAAFQSYYNAHPFLSSEDNLRLARLGLIDATRQVIVNGLNLLAVSAPEQM